MKRIRLNQIWLVAALLAVFVMAGFTPNALAQTTKTDQKKTKTNVSESPTISQMYEASEKVQRGMIVMIDPKDTERVVPMTNDDPTSMHGVVVAANETVLSLGGEAKISQVHVANNGKYEVLVSTQNGSIKNGDLITISALDGIGMKANASQTVVLGKALTAFDGKHNVSGNMALKTSTGKKDVLIGKIAVDISISHNPLSISITGPPVPAVLKKAGEVISGKPVSSVRLYVSLAILLVTVFVTGSLLYGGVRSSLVAIGRNPLAKKSIVRGLIQVIVLGLITFVLGLFSVYLLLKL